jgi:hypothetical protein
MIWRIGEDGVNVGAAEGNDALLQSGSAKSGADLQGYGGS